MDNTRSLSRRRLALLALTLAGLGLMLWLATARAVRVGDAYRETIEPPELLFDRHPIGQIITPPLDQLVGIRLWLRAPAGARGTVSLLVRSLDQQRDIATIELPAAGLPAAGPTTFSLPADMPAPLQTQRRETLELMLTTRGVDQAAPIRVEAGKNGYGYGLLLRDGREIPKSDLAFETLYQACLLDRIAPVSTIAYGRPGIFGAPQFYALLIYAVLVILARFADQILRAGFERRNPAKV